MSQSWMSCTKYMSVTVARRSVRLSERAWVLIIEALNISANFLKIHRQEQKAAGLPPFLFFWLFQIAKMHVTRFRNSCTISAIVKIIPLKTGEWIESRQNLFKKLSVHVAFWPPELQSYSVSASASCLVSVYCWNRITFPSSNHQMCAFCALIDFPVTACLPDRKSVV